MDESVFNPWVLMVIGALLVVLALEENQGNEVAAMACLAAVLLFIGGIVIFCIGILAALSILSVI